MAKPLFALLALLAIQYSFAAQISFRWCASSIEMAKCNEFIKYANMTANDLTLRAACVNATDCMMKIKNNEADLVTLDGGEIYVGGKDHDLVPIVSEKYGQYGVKYYAVAVVKKSSTGFNLTSLEGRKSCHTGARRTAGWNVPVGYLLRTGIMPPVACGDKNYDLKSASKFFSQSCVPGADALLGDEASKYSNLCVLCNGTGTTKCSKDASKNAYVSYHGAFKCMGDGKGDVAFVKYTTTREVVADGGYGSVEDYVLLCKDGTRKDTTKYKTCNLGFNPGHAVVTRKNNSDIPSIIKILTAMSDRYGSKQTNYSKFQLFNSTKYGTGSNLIFKDSATELVAVPDDKQTYEGYLGNDYIEDRKALSSCTTVSTTKATTPTIKAASTVTTPITEFVLLIALFSILLL